MNSKEDRFARSCVSFSDKKKKKDTYREKDGCETRNKKRDVKEELFLNIKLLEKILLKQSSMHYEQMQENSIFPTKRLFSFLFSFFFVYHPKCYIVQFDWNGSAHGDESRTIARKRYPGFECWIKRNTTRMRWSRRTKEGVKCSGKEWMVFLEYLRVVKDGKDRKAEGRAMASGRRSKEDRKREIWRDYLPWWTNELLTYSIVNILLVWTLLLPRPPALLPDLWYESKNNIGADEIC